jgi:3-oxoacyl-[acyl-carrier-protein] synthase-3
MTRVGIRAIGMYAPPDARRNDWWPQEVVASWAVRGPEPEPPPVGLSAGAARVARAAAEQARDPFLGTVERRVVTSEVSILELEARAARDAIDRSGVNPADIDLLLTHAVVPDYQMMNPACPLHARLGLSPACLAMHVEATAYSSLGQLALAVAMIRAGSARNALLVQSSVATRLVDPREQSSVHMGDGATAIVVGEVAAPYGVLTSVHHTDGRYPRSLIMSVRDGRWFDPGELRVHVADPGQLREAHLQIADTCANSAFEALARAGAALRDVAFLCVFQGTPWLQRVVYEHMGVEHLTPFSIFERFAYMSSVTIPATLFLAEQEGRLGPGDLVVVTGGGTGMTYGATVLRWGAA